MFESSDRRRHQYLCGCKRGDGHRSAPGGAWMHHPEIREGAMETPVDIMVLFVGPHFLSRAADTLCESRSGGA
jgi:hypothetical protein